jgi:hypothetical protein
MQPFELPRIRYILSIVDLSFQGFTAKVQGTSVGCTCLVDWISCGNADPCASLPLRATNM